MKIFLSYGHDSDAQLIEMRNENLLKDADETSCIGFEETLCKIIDRTIQYGATYITRRNSENHHQ